MDLALRLGERYLWVDSLCIIQDDVADKRHHLPLMGDIYHHAKLVVIAAVEDAHSGLPGIGSNIRQHTAITESVLDMRLATCQPQLRPKLQATRWVTRGWTYQEATDRQAYWSCREESWCEDRFTEFEDIGIGVKHSSLFSECPSSEVYFTDLQICKLGEYYFRVHEFSSRRFSDPEDTFWAFVGILRNTIPRFPQGYIWGLPKDCLDASLLWEADRANQYQGPLLLPTEKEGWLKVKIPSWCWIAKGRGVWYAACYSEVQPMLKWHEPLEYNEKHSLNVSLEQEHETAKNLQSTIYPDKKISSESNVFTFGLLRCTAETSLLTLRSFTMKASQKKVLCLCCSMVRATVSLPSGTEIGTIRVPLHVTGGTEEMQGEFILLSKRVRSCEKEEIFDEPSYNIMLVRRGGDNQTAYRLAWTEVKKSDWEEAGRQQKTIILG
ncbi:heterokaryon incompatibility protein-domain-containing protein [Xylariaceae sp. FL0016]|nr:heterokaryon incompatibility protein-domain-containing protein [Xylariaceae sp. FL0016]